MEHNIIKYLERELQYNNILWFNTSAKDDCIYVSIKDHLDPIKEYEYLFKTTLDEKVEVWIYDSKQKK